MRNTPEAIVAATNNRLLLPREPQYAEQHPDCIYDGNSRSDTQQQRHATSQIPVGEIPVEQSFEKTVSKRSSHAYNHRKQPVHNIFIAKIKRLGIPHNTQTSIFTYLRIMNTTKTARHYQTCIGRGSPSFLPTAHYIFRTDVTPQMTGNLSVWSDMQILWIFAHFDKNDELCASFRKHSKVFNYLMIILLSKTIILCVE